MLFRSRDLARDLAASGVIVVSGLARGIDAMAHDGALPATVAVVAGGADIVYPEENRALQERIGQEGLTVAEMPPGTVPQSRHFPRRNRIISGLSHTSVPVAPALGFCDDVSVNGAPFYVMAFVDGLVVHNHDEALSLLTVEARQNASRSLVDTMAAIHAVDLKAAGLDNLGKHEDYVARQMKRWYGQWNQQNRCSGQCCSAE